MEARGRRAPQPAGRRATQRDRADPRGAGLQSLPRARLRRGADTLRSDPRSVAEIFEQGGLVDVETLRRIGPSQGRSIRELVKTARLPMLERLRGEADPVELQMTCCAGIGRRTAERLHHDLEIENSRGPEGGGTRRATRGSSKGSGQKRLAGVRESLAQRLGRVRHGHEAAATPAGGGAARRGRGRTGSKAAAFALRPPIAPRRATVATPRRESSRLPVLAHAAANARRLHGALRPTRRGLTASGPRARCWEVVVREPSSTVATGASRAV